MNDLELARWCEGITDLTDLGTKYGIEAKPLDPDGDEDGFWSDVTLRFTGITSPEHLAEQVRALATTMETHLAARANRTKGAA